MQRTILYGNECMTLQEDGNIGREHVTPSGNWRVLAAYEYNNSGHQTRRYTLTEILEHPENIPWQFKNGKQRVFIRDMDHGTVREWRSPNHKVF